MLNKEVLDESVPKQTFIQHNFLSFCHFLQILKVLKPIEHFTQHAMISMLDEIFDWLVPAIRKITESESTKCKGRKSMLVNVFNIHLGKKI